MNNSKKYTFVGAIVCVSAVVAVGMAAKRPSAHVTSAGEEGPGSRKSDGKELLPARQEIAELRRAVRRLESRSTGVERSLANLPSPRVQELEVGDHAEPLPAAPAPEREVGLQAHFRYADGYRAYVASEDRDPVWAREKETELQTFVDSGSFKGYSLSSLECKQTLCALELHNEGAPDPAEDPESVRQYLGRAPFAGQSYWAPSEHGLLVVLSREGQELPNPASLAL